MNETPSYYAIIPANVRYTKLPANAKLLFGEITALSNKDGYCFATNKYFATLYNVSERVIQMWIKKLTTYNFISVELVSNNERKIYLSGVKISSPPPENNFTPLLIYNNTSNNILYKEKVKKESETNTLPFTTDEFKITWSNFVNFRKEIKHQLTKTSTTAIFNKLSKFTEIEAIEMLQASIENGWRGVFPVKQFVKKKVSPIKMSNFDGQESGFVDGNY